MSKTGCGKVTMMSLTNFEGIASNAGCKIFHSYYGLDCRDYTEWHATVWRLVPLHIQYLYHSPTSFGPGGCKALNRYKLIAATSKNTRSITSVTTKSNFTHTKFLEMNIDYLLGYSIHIDGIATKLNSASLSLQILTKCVYRYIFKNNILIYSRLLFCTNK